MFLTHQVLFCFLALLLFITELNENNIIKYCIYDFVFIELDVSSEFLSDHKER